MAKRVTVNAAEQAAARYVVKRNAATGRFTPATVTKIANAGRSRSATSGRYVAKKSATDPK